MNCEMLRGTAETKAGGTLPQPYPADSIAQELQPCLQRFIIRINLFPVNDVAESIDTLKSVYPDIIKWL